jgi:DmsE family decaheme c-type cytochrome
MRNNHSIARLRHWALALTVVAVGGLVPPPAGAEDAAAPAASGYSKKGADTCLGCHNDDAALAGLFRTAHGRPGDPRAPFGHGQLQCEACHGPGDAHARGKGKSRPQMIRFGGKSGTPVAAQNDACLGCHRGNAKHWAGNAHAANEVSCADCHKSHQAQDPVRARATQAEVCTGCHQARRADLLKPSHHPLPEGKMACSSCHAPHGSTTPSQLIRDSVTETCTSCHTDYRGPFLWEHAPVAEDCGNCHQPHGSTQPAMLKARAPFLCQQCHEAQGHPAVAYTPDGLPGRGGPPGGAFLLAGSCTNCHAKVHGSNHPSGSKLMR